MAYSWLLKPRALMFIPMLAVLVIAVACGGDEDTPPAPTSAAPEATATSSAPEVTATSPAPEATATADAPAPAATPTAMAMPTPTTPPVVAGPGPKYGGIIPAQAATGSPSTWDPHTAVYLEDIQVIGPMYNQLLEFNPLNDTAYVDGDIIGDLAESWSVSDDGLTWTFRMRQDAIWSDGEKIDADDAAYTLDRIVFQPGPRPMAGKINPYVEGFAKVDEYTVSVTIKYPSPAFLSFFATDYMKVLPQHILDGTDVDLEIFEEHTVAGGPFKAVTNEHGVAAEFEKNVNYWKEGLPYWDGYKAFFITDIGTETAAFRTERILMCMDAICQMGVDDAQRLERDEEFTEKFGIYWFDAAGAPAIILNVLRPPFDDARVRRALQLTINRSILREGLYGGRGGLGAAMGPGNPMALPEEELLTYPGYRLLNGEKHPDDIAEAQALMAAAGYTEDNPLETSYVLWQILSFADLGLAVKEQWESVLPIKITAVLHDFASTVHVNNLGDFEMTSGGRANMIPDPDDSFARNYLPHENNWSGWTDPRVTDLWNRQSRELDPAKRKDLVYEMQRILYTEMDNGYVEQSWFPLIQVVSRKIKVTDGESVGPFVKHWSLYTRLKHEHEFLDDEY